VGNKLRTAAFEIKGHQYKFSSRCCGATLKDDTRTD